MNAVECLRPQASSPSGPDDYTLAPISAVRIERAAYRVPRSEVSARQRHWEPVSGFEPLTVRLQGQSRKALCRPAKTEVTDERNRARRKVQIHASRADTP